jgi:hypothetical protein
MPQHLNVQLSITRYWYVLYDKTVRERARNLGVTGMGSSDLSKPKRDKQKILQMTDARESSAEVTTDCRMKNRSWLVVRYRLEAYATLRRCQVATGTRKRLQEHFHTSRASPESNVA